MGTVIPQTKHEVLEPGTYRAKVGAVAVEDGTYGPQVALRFDLLDDGGDGPSVTHRFIQAWAKAKLSGGKRPSKLYSWTSALLFAGKALPEQYDLDTDALLDREALALVEVTEKDGMSYNRIVQLLPLRAARKQPDAPEPEPPAAEAPAPAEAGAAWPGGWVNGEDLPY
jgi:hypothetical protein